MKDWKQAERRIASILGGVRVPVPGRRRGDAPDILHPRLSVEVKLRSKLSAWIEEGMRQSESLSWKIASIASIASRAERRSVGASARHCHQEAREERDMDAERTEAIESELDRIIERRAAEGRDAGRVEELWREAGRLHGERRRKETAAAWYGYHMDQAERLRRTMTTLVEFHEAKAQRLLSEKQRKGSA